jgi:hypothetical protein
MSTGPSARSRFGVTVGWAKRSVPTLPHPYRVGTPHRARGQRKRCMPRIDAALPTLRRADGSPGRLARGCYLECTLLRTPRTITES